MSEILKIINEKNPEEIQDMINNKVNNAEERVEIEIALKNLSQIDSLIPKYNIDMSYDKTNGKFYLLSGEHILKIPLNGNDILDFGKELALILNNDKTLGITGKKDFRRIYEVPMFGGISRGKELIYRGTQFNGNNLNINLAEQNNRFVEEIYKFTQNIKGIPENKWITERWMRQGQEMGNY